METLDRFIELAEPLSTTHEEAVYRAQQAYEIVTGSLVAKL
jgi:hypothetical protein